MTWTSVDRWTCPECGGTEVPDVSEPALPAAIRRAQKRHARNHAAELTATMKASSR